MVDSRRKRSSAEACSLWWSRTIRTARARTSGEYRGTRFVIAPSSQGLEPPANPARGMRLRLIALLKARPDRKHEAAAALLTNHIVTQLRANGNLVRDEDLARVSPLFRPHITPSGSYFPFAPKPDSGGRADRNLSRPITLREIRHRQFRMLAPSAPVADAAPPAPTKAWSSPPSRRCRH